MVAKGKQNIWVMSTFKLICELLRYPSGYKRGEDKND